MSIRKRATLREFVQDERRQVCVVCKLPRKIREQVHGRPRHYVDVAQVLRWLTLLGYKVTRQQLRAHGSARHHFKSALKW